MTHKKSGDTWWLRYISPYAATSTREDFAETFMFYMKHKGKLPKRFANNTYIKEKWATIDKIISLVATGND